MALQLLVIDMVTALMHAATTGPCELEAGPAGCSANLNLP
jgi:hypothetical protein